MERPAPLPTKIDRSADGGDKALDFAQILAARRRLQAGTGIHGIGQGGGNGAAHIVRIQPPGQHGRIAPGEIRGRAPIPGQGIAARQRPLTALHQVGRHIVIIGGRQERRRPLRPIF